MNYYDAQEISKLKPAMDTPCECGLRYGQHRVNDYACMNQKWSPGNGQPQWRNALFRRAT